VLDDRERLERAYRERMDAYEGAEGDVATVVWSGSARAREGRDVLNAVRDRRP
jgi:hypothetical protein